MADETTDRAGSDLAAKGPFSFTTLPLLEVEELVDFICGTRRRR